MAPGPADRRLGHRLAAGSFVLLTVLLPALLAFTDIAAPSAPGEKERIVAALSTDPAQDTPLALFYRLTVPADVAENRAEDQLHIVAQARRAGLLALLVVSGLVYVLVAMVRGPAAGVVTCLCLCLVPAVAHEGHVLRPEQCATMIGLLGVLLTHLYPDALRRRRDRRPIARWLNRAGIVVCVSLCFGVSMACLPEAGIYLLLPGGALLLVAMCLVAVFPRVVRRRGIQRWPYAAASVRLLPWVAMCLVNLGLGYVVLVLVPGASTGAHVAEAGMLPGPWYLLVPALALLLVGGLRMVLGVGLKLGREGRVGSEALLLIYAAALLLQHLGGPPRDHLPAAPAVAILMGEGAGLLLRLGAGRLAGAGHRS